MPNSTTKQTSPSDFVILESYNDQNKNAIIGQFPIYISGVSECCKDENGHIEAISITIPPQ
jgi:hypothetical protein